MFSKPAVMVGDRFTKVGSFRMPVWKVASITQSDIEPPHAQLQKEDFVRDSITVSIPALTDSNLFRRVVTP